MSAVESIRDGWNWLLERWRVEDTVLTAETDQTWWIVGIIFAIFALMQTPLWEKILKLNSTIIHEMGHSIIAKLTGRKLHGIKVHSDSSGVSVSAGKPTGIGMLLTTIAGYPSPAIMALLLSIFASLGYAGASLIVYNIVLVFAFLLCRNIVGFLSIATALISTGIISWINNPEVVSWTVVVLILFYGLSAVQDVWDLARVHFGTWNGGIRKEQRIESREERKTSDAHQAFKLSLVIPAPVWVALFALVNIACFVISLYFLLV